MHCCLSTSRHSNTLGPLIVLTIALSINIGAFAQSNASAPLVQTPTPAALPDPQSSVLLGGATASASTTVLNPGDLVEVAVFGVPELNQRARIDVNGQIYLPLLGYQNIGGLTAGKAQENLEKALVDGGFVKSPHVSIYVAESSQGITAFGEIQKPGMYSPSTVHTLLDLVTIAGGFTPSAGNSAIIAHRDGTEPTTIEWKAEADKIAALAAPVRQGDTVTISKAPIIYVVGEVVAPSGFIYDYNRKLTVLQAIAMAHGTTKDASLNGARLVRKSPTGIQDVQIQLKKIMQAKAPDIELEPNDILFVPTSAGKQAARKTIDTMLAISGAAIIRY
jgi:polysaccharide biosynthesis/export protein